MLRKEHIAGGIGLSRDTSYFPRESCGISKAAVILLLDPPDSAGVPHSNARCRQNLPGA